MANLAQAFAGGFESGQAIGDTIVADRDLKQAQAESGPGADLFTTYQKAGQMAMQSGNTRVADKFLKQANEFKGEALKQHISELKVHQGEVEALYQDLQGSKTKEDLLGRVNSAAAGGRLSEAEKLEYSGAINKLTDEQVPAFIEAAGKKTLGYKEQLDVQSKIAHDALEQDRFKEEKRHHIVTERNQAINASGKPTHAEKKAEKVEEHTQGRLEKAQDTLTAEKRRIRDLDPKKFDKKAKDELIAQAELDYEEDTASLRKPEAAPTKSDVASVTDVDKNKLISLNKEGKLTKGQKEEFDSHYGPGAADKILGGAKGPAKAEPKEQPKPEAKKELTDEEQLAEDLSKAAGVQERNAIRNDYNIRQDRKAEQAKQKAIAAKGKEKTEAAVAKAQKQGLVLSGMSGTQLKFVDPKTGKEVLESEL